MKTLIHQYRPAVDIDKLDIEDFCEEYVKAEWLEARFFDKLTIAVNHGFAGKEKGEDSEEA